MFNEVSNGRIVLNTQKLKLLRERRGLSQEKMADVCQSRKIRISLSSIKRAETGNPMLYRIAAEFAKFHQTHIDDLLNFCHKNHASLSISDRIPPPDITHLEQAAHHADNIALASCYWLACIRFYILNQDTEKAMIALDKVNGFMSALQKSNDRFSLNANDRQDILGTSVNISPLQL